MLKTAIAHSLELDSQDAIKEVLEQCRETLGELQAHAGMLFAGIDHDFALILNKINEAYPGIELIGCTTAGEISSIHGVTDDSLVLTLFHSDEMEFKAGVAERLSEDTSNNIKETVETAKSSLTQEPKLCFVTPGGLSASGDAVIEGLQQALGEAFPIFGGSAGDQFRITGTYQFCHTDVYEDAVPFLMLAGPLMYSCGVESGWMPIGEKAEVTQAENNVVYRIGDQTTVDFFQHYLGKMDGIQVEYPLAVFEEDESSYFLRASATFDEEKGSKRFQGDVPEGAIVQMTHSTRDNIVEGAKMSVDSAIAEYPGSKPSLAICFSCMARKQVLGTRVEEEYQILKSHFPDLPVAGFYTYGEIGPLNRGKPTRFHNNTFLSVFIGTE